MFTDASNNPHHPGVHDETVRHAVLEVACKQVGRAVLMNLAILALVVAGLSEEIPVKPLAIWYGLTAALAIPRLAAAYGFRHHRDRASVGFWSQALAVTLIASSASWGIGVVVFMPDLSPYRQMFLYAFVTGMSTGTALFYSAQRLGALFAVIAMLMPATVWLWLQAEPLARLIATGGLFVLVATARVVFAHGDLVRKYFGLVQELQAARDDAERTARTDHLTGLANRRSFHEIAHYLIEQSRRHQRPMSLLLIDLDDFKSINDRHGHATGDETLCHVARALKKATRQVDVAGRIGGDEFAVLLPETSVREIERVVARLEGELELTPTELTNLKIRCSMGAGELLPGEDLSDWMARVDQALYRSKAEGRSRLTVAKLQ